MSIPWSLLREGDNTVRLIAAGGPRDISLVDRIRLTYTHNYQADGNALRLTAAANQPSSLRQPANGADLLLITQRQFFPAVEALKMLRQSEGLSVAVVDIADIYDEFSYGNKSPQAVKDFVAYAASNWKKAPRYLLLGGDASYDERNYLGLGEFDLVPTKLVDTALMETAGDD